MKMVKCIILCGGVKVSMEYWKVLYLHPTSPPLYVRTAQAKGRVCTLCRTTGKVLPTANIDLIRQRVLLPVRSCLLLHTRWLADNTLQCDCWNWRLLGSKSLSFFHQYIDVQSADQVSLLFSCHKAGLWVVAVNIRLPLQHHAIGGIRYIFHKLEHKVTNYLQLNRNCRSL